MICDCAGVHDTDEECECQKLIAKNEWLKDQIRVLVEAMLNAQVDIPTGTYPINGPLTMKGAK